MKKEIIKCKVALFLAMLFGVKKWEKIMGNTVNFWIGRLSLLRDEFSNY